MSFFLGVIVGIVAILVILMILRFSIEDTKQVFDEIGEPF